MTLHEFLSVAFEPAHGKEVAKKFKPSILKRDIGKIGLDLIQTVASEVNMELMEMVELMRLPRCRVCGCTDNDCSKCIKKTGVPCFWIDTDLCSACGPTDRTLTKREEEVYQLLLKGKLRKEIAAELFVDVYTIDTHVKHIYKKKNVRRINQLFAAANSALKTLNQIT